MNTWFSFFYRCYCSFVFGNRQLNALWEHMRSTIDANWMCVCASMQNDGTTRFRLFSLSPANGIFQFFFLRCCFNVHFSVRFYMLFLSIFFYFVLIAEIHFTILIFFSLFGQKINAYWKVVVIGSWSREYKLSEKKMLKIGEKDVCVLCKFSNALIVAHELIFSHSSS